MVLAFSCPMSLGICVPWPGARWAMPTLGRGGLASGRPVELWQ